MTARGDDDRQPPDEGQLTSMEALLERLDDAKEGREQIRVRTILELVGFRSFGPLLLVPALIVLSPLSGVPGLPSVMAVLVILIAGQILVGRHHFWLPRWVFERQIPCRKFDAALRFLRPIASRLDKLIKPRLTLLTRGIAIPVVALLCILVAATMVPLELIPFGNSTAGAALTAFGLALIARDGLLILLGLAFVVGLGTLLLTVAI